MSNRHKLIFQFSLSATKRHPKKKQSLPIANTYTLWLFNVAMGNGPFIKMLYLLKMVDLSMANC